MKIIPSAKSYEEVLRISERIIEEIEYSKSSLHTISLLCLRLARLTNDETYQKIFYYEAGGYSRSTSDGISVDVFSLCRIANRIFKEKTSSGLEKEYAYTESVGSIEQLLKTTIISLEVAKDPDISISSSNPNQYVSASHGNCYERENLREIISKCTSKLDSRRAFLYSYAIKIYNEVKYSKISGDIFERIRENVDNSIGELVPNATNKFTSIYESMLSENPENWSNAVHTCRKILQDLADTVFPPQNEKRKKNVGKKEVEISLGSDQYVNRLMCYVEDNSHSERFNELVGSNLDYLGDRLDAIFRASQKGSHSTIYDKDEADRYIVYTYMIVGDILKLTKNEQKPIIN